MMRLPMRMPWPLLLLFSSCLLPGHWTGRRAGMADLDGVTVTYREFLPPDRDGPVHFIWNTRNPQRDLVTLAGMMARDDGYPPDRVGGDEQFTGTYVLSERRRDPRWLQRTRATRLMESGRALGPRDERTHPYAHRRFMTGGEGGEFDNGSVCPPGFVQTGVRYKRDEPGKSIAQAGALCRAWERILVDGTVEKATRSLVEASTWGEDIKSGFLNVECPLGQAVLANGQATMGTWMRYQVLTGITLRCASMTDPARTPKDTLAIGFPDESSLLPLSCEEARDARVVPFSSGMRVISGQRIDAIGMLCEPPDERTPLPLTQLKFSHPPTGDAQLALPFNHPGATILRTEARRMEEAGGVVTLPVADASLVVRAVLPGEGLSVVAMMDGCVSRVHEDGLLLAHPTCDNPLLLAQYHVPAQWTVTTEMMVTRGAVLGSPREPVMRVRLVATSLKPQVDDHGIGPTELSIIRGAGDERLLISSTPEAQAVP